jgi:hypothetical protein
MIKEEGRSNKKYEGNQRTPPSAFTITSSREMFYADSSFLIF